jgi:Predicted ABC-type transport system involved in lysophospholipase L1 biosynthesis, permease component
MRQVSFFLKTAAQHLWRGGQRNLVAFFCVVFGVMSLVSMNTLAQSIQQMLTLKPYELIGGDLTLDRTSENVISPEEEAELQSLKTAGTISDYTLMDYTTSLAFHRPGSAVLIYPSYGMGVDPAKYPLAGNLTLTAPEKTDLANVLTGVGDVIITRDMALNENLKVGDAISLSDLNYGISVPAVIKGIASDTPNHQGSKVYYSHQTALALMGSERSANTVLVNSPDPDQAQKILQNQGWRVFTAQELANATAVSQGALAMGVNDIGLLGLLVGAIGIANTMQVLLRRRRKEVAVWKTLGYTTRQIEALFAMEAALLGVGGSLAGVGLGVLLSRLITGIFSRVTTVLVVPQPSLLVMVSGFVIGTLITVVFALWAIVTTSQVPPLALLRQDAVNSSTLPGWKLAGLGILVGGVFVLAAAWVLKSVFTGLIVLAVTLVLLWIVGLVLLGLMRLILKIFPMKHWPLAKIARNNLRKRSASLIMAMIALFIGVEMFTLGAVITQSGSNVVSALGTSRQSENLAVYTTSDQESTVRDELNALGIVSGSADHLYQVKKITLSGEVQGTLDSQIMSREKADAYTLSGQPWNSLPDGAYLPNYFDAKVGDPVQVVTTDGRQVILKVAGKYNPVSDFNWPSTLDKILVSEETARLLGAPSSSQFFLSVAVSALEKDVTLLQQKLPQTIIIAMPEYLAHYLRVYENLFWFIAVMSGLAVLAGLLLVANSVNLTMLERRYEIGVFKSLGYSRGQVLFTQVLEYSLMSVVVAGVGLLFIWVLLMVAKLLAGSMGSMLTLQPITAAAVLLLTVGLTAGVTITSCWNPTKVSPILTFNDRE